MKDLIKTIWKILCYVDRIFTIFRNAIFNTLLFLLIIFIVIGISQTDKQEEKSQVIPEGTILKLAIVGKIVEQRRFPEPLERLFADLEDTPKRETYLQDILDAINHAANDRRIAAILLDTTKMTGAGLNQLHSIGDALLNFRRSKREVIAAADSYRQGQYFLASYASRIFLNPMGSVDIRGMGHYSLYFKEALDKLHIDYNIFKVGTFKSATEPFTRSSMSAADKEQSRIWLSAIWNDFSRQITRNRKLPPEALQRYVDNLALEMQAAQGDSARLAADKGLIDAIHNRQETKAYLREICGKTEEQEVNYISIDEYLDSTDMPRSYSAGSGEIAIIVAEGIILDGRQRNGFIGGDSLAKRIQQAKENDEVKALVLRINSGGGSAFASEIIRQELLDFKRSGKKLVVSMGSIAASGGYWIAAEADQIWASPSTLTGSIGVFGALPTFQRTLARAGVYSDGISTAPHIHSQAPLQALSPAMQSVLQQSVEHTYRIFIDIVKRGRNMARQKVEELAQGRVYAGTLAKRTGLVDELGDLQQAVAAARKLIGIEEARAFYLRPKQSFREQIIEMFNSVRIRFGAALLPQFARGELRTLLETVQYGYGTPLLPGIMYDRNAIYSYTPSPLTSEKPYP